MADEADVSDEIMALLTGGAVADIRRMAAEIPKGSPGDCDFCGEHSMRLVVGACAPCRDRLKLN